MKMINKYYQKQIKNVEYMGLYYLTRKKYF